LRQWDLPESSEIVIRRRVARSGRGAATVNGAQVSIAQLKSLGEALLEIHGQHQGQALLDEESHRELLDGLAVVFPAAEATRQSHLDLSAALSALRRSDTPRRNGPAAWMPSVFRGKRLPEWGRKRGRKGSFGFCAPASRTHPG